ncbi:MAG: hypothetical protein J6J78_04685 [Clostridia bacterium]|nr:hypothetical protein [Clostridia bacterium]
MKERSNSGSSAYTPNMDMPSEKKSNRALTGLVLTLLLPPIGLIYLWREGVFRTRGRMLLTCIATLEMALFFALVMPAPDMNMEAPMPVAPVAATIAPDDGVVTALSNIDQLLAQQQAERDAAAGIVTPEPTQDNAAYMAEQQAILDTTVYCVYGKGARYYHKDSVCGTQSNRRALTVREAMGEGMGACAQCNPPVYIG